MENVSKRKFLFNLDRLIIIVGLILCIGGSVALLLSDSLFQGDEAGEEIGFILSKDNAPTRRKSSSLSWFNLDLGEKIYDGDYLFTQESDVVLFDLKNEYEVTIGPNSLVKLSMEGDAFNFDLDYGNIKVKAKPYFNQKTGHKLKVNNKNFNASSKKPLIVSQKRPLYLNASASKLDIILNRGEIIDIPWKSNYKGVYDVQIETPSNELKTYQTKQLSLKIKPTEGRYLFNIKVNSDSSSKAVKLERNFFYRPNVSSFKITDKSESASNTKIHVRHAAKLGMSWKVYNEDGDEVTSGVLAKKEFEFTGVEKGVYLFFLVHPLNKNVLSRPVQFSVLSDKKFPLISPVIGDTSIPSNMDKAGAQSLQAAKAEERIDFGSGESFSINVRDRYSEHIISRGESFEVQWESGHSGSFAFTIQTPSGQKKSKKLKNKKVTFTPKVSGIYEFSVKPSVLKDMRPVVFQKKITFFEDLSHDFKVGGSYKPIQFIKKGHLAVNFFWEKPEKFAAEISHLIVAHDKNFTDIAMDVEVEKEFYSAELALGVYYWKIQYGSRVNKNADAVKLIVRKMSILHAPEISNIKLVSATRKGKKCSELTIDKIPNSKFYILEIINQDRQRVMKLKMATNKACLLRPMSEDHFYRLKYEDIDGNTSTFSKIKRLKVSNK